MYVWAGLSAALSLLPPVIWYATRVRRRRARAARIERRSTADRELTGKVTA
jgi:hypothetical protein